MGPTPLVHEIGWVEPIQALHALRALPAPVLLESARTDPRLGRFSYLGADPFSILTSKDGRITLSGRSFTGDPFLVLQRLLRVCPLTALPGMPPFQGGAMGYLGYDLCHHLERLPYPPLDDLAFPDMALGFYDVVIAFDHAARRAFLLSSGLPETTPQARMARQQARLAHVRQHLGRIGELPPLDLGPQPVEIVSNFERAPYEGVIAQTVEYILAGDIFQANISQRFRAELPQGLDRLALYRRLSRRNPAPFAAYLDFGDVALLSASPERFLSLREGQVETRPIKGTRPRGGNPARDAALAEALLASEKDRAENVMIVDLLRNDLSRVCREHTVLTPEICVLESFTTVHHLVSTVTGELGEGTDAVDLLRATFPGGSITGAPKVRAMEIIAELEPTRRGPYCGAIGWIGFDGGMDTSITIRTYCLRGRTVTFQAGGGITADSDPAAEYEETLDKACALRAALSEAL
jgi:para-aminobenzoate synthetase component 1